MYGKRNFVFTSRKKIADFLDASFELFHSQVLRSGSVQKVLDPEHRQKRGKKHLFDKSRYYVQHKCINIAART